MPPVSSKDSDVSPFGDAPVSPAGIVLAGLGAAGLPDEDTLGPFAELSLRGAAPATASDAEPEAADAAPPAGDASPTETLRGALFDGAFELAALGS